MSLKEKKKGTKSSTTVKSSATYVAIDDHSLTSNYLNVSLLLEGSPGVGDWLLLLVFNGKILLETKWQDQSNLSNITLPLKKDPPSQSVIADQPLIFLLRATGGKVSKDHDPLLNMENKAGCSVDLFPLVLGESKINLKVPFISVHTGIKLNCQVGVYIKLSEDININKEMIPLTLTMISAHCLPLLTDNTVYLSAMELANIHSPPVVNFGKSLSSSTITNIVWASASSSGQAANTSYNVPIEDKFIPSDLDPKVTENCVSVYWNTMRRILVDSASLRNRLKSHFVMDIAAVSRLGKNDVRGHYMAFVDAGVLLEAHQFGVTICAKLFPFNEDYLPENIVTILELSSSSAKTSAREQHSIMDEYGHFPYIVVRFDLCEPLTPKTRTVSYYEIIGLSPPSGLLSSIFELKYTETRQKNKPIDAKCIRREAGALAVHEELNKLAPGSVVQTKQNIKHTAANNLLLRIRLMLKQFPLENSDNWQDIITAHHRASLHSVLASFAPQTRVPKFASQFIVARSRLAGDERIAAKHIEINLQTAPNHPEFLFSKALRCLEDRNDIEARNYLLKSLNSQPRNKYLLWTLGGIDFNKYETSVIANAAFHIAVKGDTSDGITGVIGWAALHTLSHFWKNSYAAFVAARKMLKCFEIGKTWKQFIERWINISGEEEIYWDPSVISCYDPFLITSAFFLCLKCFDFSEKLLQCFENGCSTRLLRFGVPLVITYDVCYLRIASLVLRNQVKEALLLTEDGMKKFGPSAAMSQIRATCLLLLRDWDKDCETAISEVERAGAKPSSFLLYRAALGKLNTDPEVALQYAARVHNNTPSAFTAFLIARIYAEMGDEHLAQRSAAAAVNVEPLLANGWAFLAILAMREKNFMKAKSLLRTSKQAGPLDSDIEKELKKIMKQVKMESLPNSMVENICFCDYN